jgi:hypothetical protein
MSENLQDVPSGEFRDDSYVSRPGAKAEPLPVQSDADKVEDPINEAKADTDEQLEADDRQAIDQSNVLNERTRGSNKTAKGLFREPGDEEGLPSDTGVSDNTRVNKPDHNADKLR